MINQTQLARIAAKAQLLAGEALGDEIADLAELAAQRAMAYCCRSDIPEEMEQAVALLLLNMQDGGQSVKSLQRGDTAVTYAEESPLAQLQPFRRLGRVQEEPV